MVHQPRPQLSALRENRPTTEYLLLVLLLLASMLLSRLAVPGADRLVDLTDETFGAQLLGATVYTILGLTALVGAALAVSRRRDAGDDIDPAGLVQFVGAMGLVLFVASYVLHGAVRLAVYPTDVVHALLIGGLGMALPGVVYARARGIDLRLAVPSAETRPLSLVVGQVSLVVALAAALTYASLQGFHTIPAGDDSGILPLTAGTLLWTVLVPGVLVGVGTAILYHGAIQEWLTDRVGSIGAVPAVTALIGEGTWAPVARRYVLDAGPTRPGFGLEAVAVGVVDVVVAVVAAVIAVEAVAVLSRVIESADSPLGGATVGIFVAVGPLLVLTAIGLFEATAAVGGAGFAAIAAIAAAGYEKTRSVWVPALAFSIYEIALDPHLSAALARFFL